LPIAASAAPLSPELIAQLKASIKNDPEARSQLQALLEQDPKASIAQKSKSKAKISSGIQANAGAEPEAAPKPPDTITKLIQSNAGKIASERQYSPCAGWQFLLRQDWKDLGGAAGAACPQPPDNAQGAQISFANDLAAKNRIVTINGTAAVLYNSITGDVPPPTPYAVSLGGYTTVNSVSNSAAAQTKSNVDTLAYGGLLNLGYHGSKMSNFFMFRAGITEDYVKDTTSAHAVLDWSPVVRRLYIHYPYHFHEVFGIPIITRFDPDLVARYDSALGKDQILAFNARQESVRIGPELALTVLPDPGYVSGPLARLSALFGYDIWYETYSRKRLSWFTSSLNYNLDEAGNFGIKGSYNSGQNELTGKATSIYTIGLSGKI